MDVIWSTDKPMSDFENAIINKPNARRAGEQCHKPLHQTICVLLYYFLNLFLYSEQYETRTSTASVQDAPKVRIYSLNLSSVMPRPIERKPMPVIFSGRTAYTSGGD
jgi:hypothetical protein